MSQGIITTTQEFVRARFQEDIEEHRPLAPTVKAIINVLMDEAAIHVGAAEVKGSKSPDPQRWVLKTVLATLTERHSVYQVNLILSLD